jgi:hypothetical protein
LHSPGLFWREILQPLDTRRRKRVVCGDGSRAALVARYRPYRLPPDQLVPWVDRDD